MICHQFYIGEEFYRYITSSDHVSLKKKTNAGLLGGLVYVNAFSLLSREVEPQYKEFSLAAASVADSIGIAIADVAGILLQGCLFKVNGLKGADFTC